MDSVKTSSAAFTSWVSAHMHSPALNEVDYDRAILAAQLLEREGLVSHAQWLQMVWMANEALIRCSE